MGDNTPPQTLLTHTHTIQTEPNLTGHLLRRGQRRGAAHLRARHGAGQARAGEFGGQEPRNGAAGRGQGACVVGIWGRIANAVSRPYRQDPPLPITRPTLTPNNTTTTTGWTQESVLNALVGAAFGAAGQRCMALSVAVLVHFRVYDCVLLSYVSNIRANNPPTNPTNPTNQVGDARAWAPELVQKAQGLKVGGGMEAGTDVGPLISKVLFIDMYICVYGCLYICTRTYMCGSVPVFRCMGCPGRCVCPGPNHPCMHTTTNNNINNKQEALARAEGLIAAGAEAGATVLLDGRGVKVPGTTFVFFVVGVGFGVGVLMGCVCVCVWGGCCRPPPNLSQTQT